MVNDKRILFVDDETRVLHGVRRQFMLAGHDWDMEFAGSGREALDILARSSVPFDVLVTDIRMPGMDGLALLQQVREQYPHLVRIVLTGHISRETAMRSVGLAHQFLAKPCSMEMIEATLTRAFAMRQLLASARLKQLIAQLNTLPSLPTLYNRLLREIQLPEANIKNVGQIIAQDIGMTAKILQLVNSAFFGLRRHVSNPSQAVMLLGLDTIKALVLSVHVFSQFRLAQLGEISLTQLQEHSLAVGTLAQKIIEQEQPNDHQVADFAFAAGLLHAVGRLVLAANLPADYSRALALARDNNLSLIEAERLVFEATHAEVGAYLLGIWGLPDPVVEALAYHPEPARCACPAFGPLIAVHVANALLQESYQPGTGLVLIDQNELDRLGYLDKLPEWRRLCSAKALGEAA